jgi:hypothetical protein
LEIARNQIAKERGSVVLVRGAHVHQRRHFDRTSPLRRMSLDAVRNPSDYLSANRKAWKRIKIVELRNLRQRNHLALRLLKLAFVSVNRVLFLPDVTIALP